MKLLVGLGAVAVVLVGCSASPESVSGSKVDQSEVSEQGVMPIVGGPGPGGPSVTTCGCPVIGATNVIAQSSVANLLAGMRGLTNDDGTPSVSAGQCADALTPVLAGLPINDMRSILASTSDKGVWDEMFIDPSLVSEDEIEAIENVLDEDFCTEAPVSAHPRGTEPKCDLSGYNLFTVLCTAWVTFLVDPCSSCKM